MTNFGLPEYDKQREWIRNARMQNMGWNEIIYAGRKDKDGLDEFLTQQEMLNFWKIMSCEEWQKLVVLQKEAEEQTQTLDYLSGQAMIMDDGEDNDVTIPIDPQSAWQLYRKRLLSGGFKKEVVDEMERTTLKLLKRLSGDTTQIKPVKGLVIGNVQSGKTANMAALMAMAADWGWNMFIVLSGTIENLRQQTQNRLLGDLNCQGNLTWNGLEHLSKKPMLGQRTQDLHFDKTSKQRYFTVCLKNPGRLRGLIQWLQSDANKQKQMKILVIDDEADQAGINTANINNSTIRTINRLIRDLVNGKNEKSQEISNKYMAMNYIGYTATPYANILNEAAIIATRNNHNAIDKSDIEAAVKKITVGLEKHNRVVSEKDKKLTAYHEAGHAVVSKFLETQDNVKEISIIPRGLAGGYTMYKTNEDKYYVSKTELEEKMIALLGGRAAEKIALNDISTGASNDIEVATGIARDMITVYGMSSSLGPISLKVDEPYELQMFGEDITDEVGNQVKQLVDTAYIQAQKILLDNIDILHHVATTLLEKETISEKEFDSFFENN